MASVSALAFSFPLFIGAEFPKTKIHAATPSASAGSHSWGRYDPHQSSTAPHEMPLSVCTQTAMIGAPQRPQRVSEDSLTVPGVLKGVTCRVLPQPDRDVPRSRMQVAERAARGGCILRAMVRRRTCDEPAIS